VYLASTLITASVSLPVAPTLKVLPYLDPGTGSLLIQLLIGLLLGGLWLFRAYWAKIRGHFSKGKNREAYIATERPEEENSDDHVS